MLCIRRRLKRRTLERMAAEEAAAAAEEADRRAIIRFAGRRCSEFNVCRRREHIEEELRSKTAQEACDCLKKWNPEEQSFVDFEADFVSRGLRDDNTLEQIKRLKMTSDPTDVVLYEITKQSMPGLYKGRPLKAVIVSTAKRSGCRAWEILRSTVSELEAHNGLHA